MGMLIGLVECDRFGCGHCLTDEPAGDEMRTLFFTASEIASLLLLILLALPQEFPYLPDLLCV